MKISEMDEHQLSAEIDKCSVALVNGTSCDCCDGNTREGDRLAAYRKKLESTRITVRTGVGFKDYQPNQSVVRKMKY